MQGLMITHGCTTDHGGVIHSTLHGRGLIYGGAPVRIGDPFMCPIHGEQRVQITGDSTVIWDDGIVAYTDCYMSCGAKAYAKQSQAGYDYGGGASSRSNQSKSTTQKQSLDNLSESESPVFDELFILTDNEDQPLSNMPYIAYVEEAEILRGITDENGKTERIVTDGAATIEIHIGHLEN